MKCLSVCVWGGGQAINSIENKKCVSVVYVVTMKGLQPSLDYAIFSDMHFTYFPLLGFCKSRESQTVGSSIIQQPSTFTSHSAHVQVKRDGT